MKNLYIFGTGFFDFKLVGAINRLKPTWNICGFIYYHKNKLPSPYTHHYPVLGGAEKIPELVQDNENNNYFINNQFGSEEYTKESTDILLSNGCKIAALMHPLIDLDTVQIGEGCILPEGCVVGFNAKIGNFVTMRLKSLISHDVSVEDHVFIGPGATISGKAVLKKHCYIGAGAVVLSHITIGEGSVVGAGAVVIKDVPCGAIVVGVPAKPINRGDNRG